MGSFRIESEQYGFEKVLVHTLDLINANILKKYRLCSTFLHFLKTSIIKKNDDFGYFPLFYNGLAYAI